MKTISIAEFQALVDLNDWQREQDHEVVGRLEREVENWDDNNNFLGMIEVPHVRGWASKTSTLGDIVVTYNEGFSYDECNPDSLRTGAEGTVDVWSVEGIVVVDEDGEQIDAYDLAEYLDTVFSEIDYDVLEIEQMTDIDFDEDSDMETFTVEIDNKPSIRFTGELVAAAASSDDRGYGSMFSSETGRWTELALYKTKGGKFICHQIGRTRWQGERDRHSGKVCETLAEVKEFFGYRWLAKELYEKAGIEAVVKVD